MSGRTEATAVGPCPGSHGFVDKCEDDATVRIACQASSSPPDRAGFFLEDQKGGGLREGLLLAPELRLEMTDAVPVATLELLEPGLAGGPALGSVVMVGKQSPFLPPPALARLRRALCRLHANRSPLPCATRRTRSSPISP